MVAERGGGLSGRNVTERACGGRERERRGGGSEGGM